MSTKGASTRSSTGKGKAGGESSSGTGGGASSAEDLVKKLNEMKPAGVPIDKKDEDEEEVDDDDDDTGKSKKQKIDTLQVILDCIEKLVSEAELVQKDADEEVAKSADLVKNTEELCTKIQAEATNAQTLAANARAQKKVSDGVASRAKFVANYSKTLKQLVTVYRDDPAA